MPALTIPEEYRGGVSKLRAADESTIAALALALEKFEGPSPSTKRLVEAVTALGPAVPDSDIKDMAQAVRAMYFIRSSAEVPLETFAGDLADGLEAAEGRKLSPDDRTRFKQRIVRLMGVPTFTRLAKARDLQTDDERTFCRVRVITDLRPVFGDKIEAGPEAMVVVHTLKLGYHHADRGEHKDFYITLDSDDLTALKKVIERAEAKAKSLKSSIKDVPYLGI